MIVLYMLNVLAATGLLIFITAAVMALVMLSQTKSRLHKLWGVFCVLVAMWGFGAYRVGISTSPQESLLWWRLTYMGVIFIPFLFTHFVYQFLNRINTFLLNLLYLFGALCLILDLFTDYFITGVHLVFGTIYYLSPSFLYNAWLLLWVILIVYTHGLLLIEFKHSAQERRQQLLYFFLGSLIGFVGGSFSFLPVYGIEVYPWENVFVCLYPILMGYAILRYRLWNFKVAATQALIIALWVFLLSRVFLASLFSQDQVIDGILLLATIIFGVALIRSVNKEVHLREQIQTQEQELEKVNKSLEEANQNQQNLIHFITHEVKGYFTKGQLGFGAIAEGDYGDVPLKLKNLATEEREEMRRGVDMVTEILGASNFKKGVVNYSMVPFSLAVEARRVFDEFTAAAAERHLEYTFSAPKDEMCTILGDKMQLSGHVLHNLVDNAIKYTPSGSVRVSVALTGPYVSFVVADTGVGITPEDRAHLFTEGGRGKDSLKVNAHSTGYGLFIAKSIVDAHGGRIRVESKGADKGTTFFVEFPRAGGSAVAGVGMSS